MFGLRKLTKKETTEYATHADFCRIFAADTNRLYLLSFLLTGDPAMAEQCFVSGLEDSTKANAVFKEWAGSWARRKIIENAIRMVRPTPSDGNSSGEASHDPIVRVVSERLVISALVALAPFERFVFVMSVLEGYSINNCSLLLACTRADVAAARTRALRNIGISAELLLQSIEVREQHQRVGRDRELKDQLRTIRTLAIPA